MGGPRFCAHDNVQVFNRFGRPVLREPGEAEPEGGTNCCSDCAAWTQCLQRIPIRLDLNGFDFEAWLNSLDWTSWSMGPDVATLTTADGETDNTAFAGSFVVVPWFRLNPALAGQARSPGGGTTLPFPAPFACHDRNFNQTNVDLPVNLPDGICGSHAGVAYRTVYAANGNASLTADLYLDAWIGCRAVQLDPESEATTNCIEIIVYAWLVQEVSTVPCELAGNHRQQICCELLRSDPIPITPTLQLADLVDIPLYARAYEDFLAQQALFEAWWDNWLTTDTWDLSDLSCERLLVLQPLVCDGNNSIYYETGSGGGGPGLISGHCSPGRCDPDAPLDNDDGCSRGPGYCGKAASNLCASVTIEACWYMDPELGKTYRAPADGPVTLPVDPKCNPHVKPIAPLPTAPPTDHHGNTASLLLTQCDLVMDCNVCPPPDPPTPGVARQRVEIDFIRESNGCNPMLQALVPDCLEVVEYFWSNGLTGARVRYPFENTSPDNPAQKQEKITLTVIDARGCVYTKTKTYTCGCQCESVELFLQISNWHCFSSDGSGGWIYALPINANGDCADPLAINAWQLLNGWPGFDTETGPIPAAYQFKVFGDVNEDCPEAFVEIQRLSGACGACSDGSDCVEIAPGQTHPCVQAPLDPCAWSLGPDGETIVHLMQDVEGGNIECFRWRVWDEPCGCHGPWNYFTIAGAFIYFANLCDT